MRKSREIRSELCNPYAICDSDQWKLPYGNPFHRTLKVKLISRS